MITKKYTIVTTQEQYNALVGHIESYDYLSFDTETTGLNTHKDQVIGASVSGKIGEAFYIPYKTWDKEKKELVNMWSEEEFKYVIGLLKGKDLLMWNGSYDVRIVKHSLNVDLMDAFFAEIILMKHTLQEDGYFALKKTAIELQEEIGLNAEEEANKEQIELKANVIANGGQWTKANKDMYMADLDIIGPYACFDADATLRIGEYYSNKLAEEDLNDFYYDDEVMPLLKIVTITMEDKGIKLDLPLIEKTNKEIIEDMDDLHRQIMDDLLSDEKVQEWLFFTAKEKFPARKSGNFGQRVVDFYGLTFPKSEKTGKYLLSKKLVQTLEDSVVKDFLLGDNEALDPRDVAEIQKQLWYDLDNTYVNISSKKQMGEIVFDYMNIKPLSKTDKGAAQFDDNMIHHLADKHKIEWANKLSDYNKLIKQKGAYIDRFLNGHYNGKYYFYYKQHGTVSGRFSSDAQQLPRPKEDGELSPMVLKYNNIIRAFFIPEKGRVFIDADYESLEPHVFSHVSTDEGLRDIFRNGHDFYSTIAIKTEKLDGYSADKKADNYLGKLNKPLRQSAKAYSLGIPYGLGDYALGKTLDIPQKEAKILVDGYLDGFPNLKKWMHSSEEQARHLGYVTTETGRVRHLPKVKKLYKRFGNKLLDFRFRMKLNKKYGKDQVLEWYRDYKNGLNNAKNVQIQGLSASIVNKAMVAIMLEFKEKSIDAWVCGTIHDQIIVDAPEELADECSEIVERNMCNVVELSVTLKAPAERGYNWRDTH